MISSGWAGGDQVSAYAALQQTEGTRCIMARSDSDNGEGGRPARIPLLSRCAACGGDVLLRSSRIRLRRQQALAFHIVHIPPGRCRAASDFIAVHRRGAKGRKVQLMIEQWNEMQNGNARQPSSNIF
jgi:hypothetical protein